MAKKRAARKSAGDGQHKHDDTVRDQVAAAEAAVEQARAALRHAQHAYQRTRDTAVTQTAKARNVTVGDMLDGTLEFVRRHPAAGVLAAGVMGFLLGRTRSR